MNTTFAILASGPSLTAQDALAVRHLRRVVVSDAYLLAPDAEALVASDPAWWREHPEAMKFAGKKFACIDIVPGVKAVRNGTPNWTGTNSGLVALHVAISQFGARRILLLGFDMHVRNGLHFFGPHKKNKNPSAQRMKVFCEQFATYARGPNMRGAEVINCTAGSDLKCFPFATLEQALGELAA